MVIMKFHNTGYSKSIFKFLKCPVTNSQSTTVDGISLPLG